MDVALLAASVSVTKCLTKHEATSHRAVQVVLGLSFGLFSLSVLEATPSKWLLLVGGDDEKSHRIMTIQTSYKLILSIFSIIVLVVLPGRVGSLILGRFSMRRRATSSLLSSSVDKDDEKKRQRRRSSSLGGRFVWNIFMLTFKITQYTVSWLGRRMQRCFLRQAPRGGPVLVMTTSSSPSTDSNTQRNNPPRGIFGALGGVVVTMFGLMIVTPLVLHLEDRQSLLAHAVSWLCAVGLLLSALLNGFGSVSMPHSCLVGLFLDPIRPEVINMAHVELEQVQATLRDRKVQLSNTGISITHANAAATTTPTSSGTSWYRRSSFSEMGDEVTNRKQALASEIAFLETLVEESKEEIADMRRSQAMALNARTPIGRLRSWLGVVFSVILLVRLAVAWLTVWPARSGQESSSSRSTDPITRILLWLTGHHIMSQQDTNMLSQFISLALTAFLSFSQVNTFLRTAAILNRRLQKVYSSCCCTRRDTSSSGGAGKSETTEIFPLLLASFMGCYFLSCVVLTKLMLPPEYSTTFLAAIGGPTFRIRSDAVNAVFAISAAVSAFVLGMLFGIQRQNSHRQHENWIASSPKSSPSGLGKSLEP